MAFPTEKRILVLPGGGATGIATIRVLQALEEKLNRPIYQLFDEIWASSVGAMMAAYLSEPVAGGQSARTASQVSRLLQQSFSSPVRALGALGRLRRELSPQVTLRDTLIPVRILTARVSHYRGRRGLLAGNFQTENIGLSAELCGDLSLVDAVGASCAVYPLLSAQRLSWVSESGSSDEVSYCIDSGCRVCSEPMLNPAPFFMSQWKRSAEKRQAKTEDSVKIFFISNGWARWQESSSQSGVAPGSSPSSVEVYNFDLNLGPWLRALGPGKAQQRLCANFFAAGFVPGAFLDSLAKNALFGDQWGVFQRMLDDLGA